MATAANLAVSVTARTQRFERGMNRSRKFLGRFSKSVQASQQSLLAFGKAMAGVLIARAGIQAFSKTLLNVSAIGKWSDKLGIATERLIGLEHAALQTGVQVSQFRLGLQRMTRRIAEAALGMGEAQQGIKDLGLSAKDLAKLAPDQQFAAIADAMERVTTQGERVRLAFKLFDSEGVALVNTLRGGSAALRAFQKEAEALGLTLTRDQVRQFEKLDSSLIRIGALWEGLKRNVVSFWGPAIESVLEAMNDKLKTTVRHFKTLDDFVGGFASKIEQGRREEAKLLEEFDRLNFVIATLKSKKFAEGGLKLFERDALRESLKELEIVRLSIFHVRGLIRSIRMEEAFGPKVPKPGPLGLFGGLFGDSEQAVADFAAKAIEQLSSVPSSLRDMMTDAVDTIRSGIDRAGKAIARFSAVQNTINDLIREMRTPLEIYSNEMADLQKLFKTGLLPVITFFRKMLELQNRLKDATRTTELEPAMPQLVPAFRAPSAIRAGSAEAARIAARSTGRSVFDDIKTSAQKAAETAAKQLAEEKAIKRAIIALHIPIIVGF